MLRMVFAALPLNLLGQSVLLGQVTHDVSLVGGLLNLATGLLCQVTSLLSPGAAGAPSLGLVVALLNQVLGLLSFLRL